MDDPAGVVGFCQRVRPRLVGTLGLLCGDRAVGEELAQETLATDYDLRAALYDPERNSWRRLPRVPIQECDGYPDVAANGRVALVRGCAYALWDLEAGRWVKIRDAPRNGQGRMVAAGPVFLIAGANHESSANGLVAYHP